LKSIETQGQEVKNLDQESKNHQTILEYKQLYESKAEDIKLFPMQKDIESLIKDQKLEFEQIQIETQLTQNKISEHLQKYGPLFS